MSFIIIPPNDTLIADIRGSRTKSPIRVSNAGIQDIHAARHVGSHDVASGFIEDWLGHAGVCRAQRLPVPESGIL